MRSGLRAAAFGLPLRRRLALTPDARAQSGTIANEQRMLHRVLVPQASRHEARLVRVFGRDPLETPQAEVALCGESKAKKREEYEEYEEWK